MLRLWGIVAGFAFAAAACGGAAVAPMPTPTNAPTPSTSVPAPTAAPTAVPATGLDHAVVYVARDLLPPIAVHVEGAGLAASPEERILTRLGALYSAVAPAGTFNTVPITKARPTSVMIDHDLATIDFRVPSGDWGTAGSAGTRAFIQQLVYTATEEPGIRRVLITENGQQAVIGGEGVVIDHPVSREDILGYSFAAPRDEVRLGSEPRSVPLPLTAAVWPRDDGRARTRFMITADAPGAEGEVPLAFSARIAPNDDLTVPLLGKWVLAVDVPFATTASPGTVVIDQTPVRSLRTSVVPGGVRYELGLDDARPWRVTAMYAPLRVVIDLGGDPLAVSPNIALYTPAFGTSVRMGYAIAGLVRAFEARFEYRIRDVRGLVVVDDFATASLGTSDLWGTFALSFPAMPDGAATVEIILRSPRDGSISESVYSSVIVAPSR